MATNITGTTIPSSFVRLDDRVTSADQYLNVRDMQVMAENHNILVTRRFSRCLLTQKGPFAFIPATPASPVKSNVMFAIPLDINTFTASLTVVLQGVKASGDTSIGVYAKVVGPGITTVPNSTAKATVSLSTPVSAYTITIDVPREASQAGTCILYICPSGVAYGADLLAASCTIIGSGRENRLPYLDVDNSSTVSSGTLLYVDSDLSISPAFICRRTAITGGQRLLLDRNLSKAPTVNSDTVNTRKMSTLTVYSISVYENPMTSFGEDTDITA